MTCLAFGPGNLTCLLIVEFLIDFPSKDFLINTLMSYHGREPSRIWWTDQQAKKETRKEGQKNAEGGIWTPEPLRERISHANILSPSRLAGLRYLCNEKFKHWIYNWNREVCYLLWLYLAIRRCLFSLRLLALYRRTRPQIQNLVFLAALMLQNMSYRLCKNRLFLSHYLPAWFVISKTKFLLICK